MADYPSTSTTKRSAAVKIMLHPDMAEKLRVLAEHLGQTPATLASIAVSQYVAQQTVALGATERAMAGFFESLAPAVQEMFNQVSETPTKAPATPRNKLLDLLSDEPVTPRRNVLAAMLNEQPIDPKNPPNLASQRAGKK